MVDAPAVKADELRGSIVCGFCRDTKRVRIDLPRDKWIPMKDGTYETVSGDTHICVRGYSQSVIKVCPVCASPSAPMPVVDEGMVDRAITAARGNDDWLRCPAAFKQHLRLEMLRALTAALTPPSSAPASEGDKT